MAGSGYDIFDTKPDLTKELFKTKKSSSSTRMEYLRMREEEALQHKAETTGSTDTERRMSHTECPAEPEEVIKVQESEPEVTSFPFANSGDTVDGNRTNDTKAIKGKKSQIKTHGVNLCMVSAVVHMKYKLQKKAKSIKQLRRNPTTSLEDKNMKKRLELQAADSDDDNDGPLGYLKGCRYLRGVKEDRELSIEDIFG